MQAEQAERLRTELSRIDTFGIFNFEMLKSERTGDRQSKAANIITGNRDGFRIDPYGLDGAVAAV